MTAKQRERILAAREQETRDIEALKLRLAVRHGLERNAKFDKAWYLAWDYGHADGLKEVEQYFDELAELLKPD